MPKLNFTNYTFIVPFHYDIPDRLENINLSLDYLYDHVNTTIYVKEMGESRHFDYNRHSGKKRLVYEYANEPFSKTKLINSMVSNIGTEFFSIHDTDVFLSTDQYKEVLKMFTIDNLDCIVPYNGLYSEIPRTSIPDLDSIGDIVDIDNQCSSRFSSGEYKGTGCCNFFRRDTFNKIGGMNEMFTKWGYEDDEVVYRIFGTGHNAIWLNNKGPIHHLSHGHSKGGFGFEHTHSNAKKQEKEYLKVKTLNLYNLVEYIKTWTKKGA